jgi:hypothetical protein
MLLLEGVPKEKAVKMEFDIIERRWNETNVEISISKQFFAEGGMRRAYRAKLFENGGEFACVAKLFRPGKKYNNEIFFQVGSGGFLIDHSRTLRYKHYLLCLLQSTILRLHPNL